MNNIDNCSKYAVKIESNNNEYELYRLQEIQNHCNELLQSRGYLYLIEVLDELGVPNICSDHVGWVYKKDNTIGDNFVDFGIYKNIEFISGHTNTILLDFNVDGIIDASVNKEEA